MFGWKGTKKKSMNKRPVFYYY